jgi:hypothetical protein
MQDHPVDYAAEDRRWAEHALSCPNMRLDQLNVRQLKYIIAKAIKEAKDADV